jgi:predicted nucleic acid-binding protein
LSVVPDARIVIAAYIDLALRPAELWTLDGKLARNAASLGFPVTLAV